MKNHTVKTPGDVIRRVMEEDMLGDPRRWRKGNGAVGSSGVLLIEHSDDVVRCDLVAAVDRVCRRRQCAALNIPAIMAICNAIGRYGGFYIHRVKAFERKATHAELMKMLALAAENADEWWVGDHESTDS